MIFQAFVLFIQAIQLPAGQVQPVGQVSHLSHFGIPKLRTASVHVPELLTVAQQPVASVVVVPMVTVAPGHCGPVHPVSPFSHLGIQKLNIAAQQVPLLLTVALHHGAKVVVVPTAIVPEGH